MKKPKAKSRKKSAASFRNATRPRRFRIPFRSSTDDNAPRAADNNNEATKGAASHPALTRGMSALWTGGGAITAATLCALAARYDVLPAVWATGIVTAVGGTTAALALHPAAQAVGQGAMAAAGAQLGFVLIDSHHQQNAVREALAASKPAPKKPANAERLPAGAVEAAYERARRRLALAEAASRMAA